MCIRPLREDEWSSWRDLRLAVLHEAPDVFGSSYEEERTIPDSEWQQRTAAFAAGGDRVMFVVEENGRWTGCAGGVVDWDGTPFVISVWVEPGRRGRRIGEALVEAVADWARRRGHRQIKLLVAHGNAPALALYERIGFRRTGATLPLRNKPAVIQDEMIRELQPEDS